MLRRAIIVALVALAVAALAQSASADPTNAKGSLPVSLMCNSQLVQVVIIGNGHWDTAHVVSSTANFEPIGFDLTRSITPPGGPTQTDNNDTMKQSQVKGTVTCAIPAALNTITFPDGTVLVLSGTVTGFFTPASDK